MVYIPPDRNISVRLQKTSELSMDFNFELAADLSLQFKPSMMNIESNFVLRALESTRKSGRNPVFFLHNEVLLF
jgi:hypothetical protein